ncbi:MAG: class I SAM-dependent methyltransferase [Proteobacteria bacterium]|nr:class I SAM-dependent methyltransferase [Pseudomonadota bacterium]
MNDNVAVSGAADQVAGPSWFERKCREVLIHRLQRLAGKLVLTEGGDTLTLGDGKGATAHLVVHGPDFYTDLVLRGSLGAAQGWMAGNWDSDDLTTLIALFARNPQLTDGLDQGWSRWAARAAAAFHHRRRNSRTGSRRNIAEHYDLGNDLFSLFLDPAMNYSSAIFRNANDPLEQAARNKLERICAKLSLSGETHVLEVGCGWGGFAIHAAREYGCRVTGITISQEQHDFAQAAVAKAGVGDKVEILLSDYRDHQGTYDRVVSIEMIEAVGHEFLGDFFARISSLLHRDGIALIQAITMPDQRYEQYLKGCDFIQRYIFPGSCVPSLGAMGRAFANRTDCKLVHLEDIGPHYAKTLRLWHDRFNARRADILALGYPEQFIRLWQYYFSYCEAGFAERYLSDVQMVLARPDWRGSVSCEALPQW